jgi:molecular chaperone DnaK
VHVPFASSRDDGSPIDLRTEITRQTLDRLTTDLVDRTLATTGAVLEAAGLTAQQLDDVLMVGGQSLAPLVRQRLKVELGREPRSDVDPHAAVALGAAILGHATVRAERGRSGITLSEILSLPIGIALRDGGLRRVLERTTPLPAEKTLSIPVNAGVPVGIAVFQGEAPRAEDNEYLGSLHLAASVSGDATLRFRVGADGRLHVVAHAPGSREEAVLATGDAADDVRAQLFAHAPLPEMPPPLAQRAGFFSRLFGRTR